VGRLTGDTAAPAPGAWELYLSEVDDADDLRPAGTGDAPDIDQPGDLDRDLTPVHWPPQKNSRRRSAVVGHRLRSRRYLHVGQPVWVRLDEGRVVRIKLSQLWRSTGEGSAGERAERDGVQPCHDPGDLCPSCRVFGSADVRGRGEGDSSEQRGYRGHVRFRDARATGEVSPLVETLAPLSAPHPSAGQFYLDNTGAPPAASRQDARPIAHWGSEADDRDLRRLRGRKFYWRTSDPLSGGTPRGRARDHHSDKLTSAVALVPATTQFTTTVTFENLTPAEIGGLLVALDPRRLDSVPSAGGAGEPSALVATVGGGRPFGLGAVTVDASLVVEDTDARYLGQEPSAAPTEAECLAAFDDSVGGAVREKVWPALRHALALDFVDRDLVWYPPGRSGERGTQPYDEGYDFWQRSNGSRFSHKVRPLVVLPDPTGSADDQILESFPEEESVPGSRSGPGGRGTGPRSGPGGRGAGPRHAGGRR
jgi:CRISPR-associated protein (TIGR03986 family)